MQITNPNLTSLAWENLLRCAQNKQTNLAPLTPEEIRELQIFLVTHPTIRILQDERGMYARITNSDQTVDIRNPRTILNVSRKLKETENDSDIT